MWTPLVEEAEKQGIILLLENVFEPEPETIQMLLEAVDSPHFAFCFDTGHWHIFGRTEVDEWLQRLGSKMTEVHLHDNHGERDEHLPPGDGTFDFGGFFSLLRMYQLSPVFTIEVRGEDALRIAFERLTHYVQA